MQISVHRNILAKFKSQCLRECNLNPDCLSVSVVKFKDDVNCTLYNSKPSSQHLIQSDNAVIYTRNVIEAQTCPLTNQ